MLLEDVSNLLANEMFGRHDPRAEDEALRQIVSLAGRVAVVIAVTIGGVSGDGSTIGISSFPPGTEGPEGADGF